LTVAQNNALGTQNVSAGTTNLKIGSYAFSASSAEGVNLNTISVELAPNSTNGWNGGFAAFQNLKLMANGVQFGTVQGVVSPNTVYSFSGSQLNVPAGQTVNIDVYADTLSNATGTYTNATALAGYSGTGQTSNTSVSLTGEAISGQTVGFNGQPELTVAIDSSNPPAGNIVQNSTGNSLAVFRFTETSNVEAVKVTQLTVFDSVASSGVKAAFSNLSLWNGSTLLGTAASPVTVSGGYNYTFNSLTNLVVPQGNSISVTLKGDAGSYTNNSLSDNTTSTFSIAGSSLSGNATQINASSTLTINDSAVLASSTYNWTVTVLGHTSPTQTITMVGTDTTSTQQGQIATAIAALLNGNYSYFGLSSSSSAVASGNVVTITSTGIASLGASATLQSFSTTISANNYLGTAAVAGISTNGVVARGNTSNQTASLTVNATGNAQTTLRTLMTIAATPVTGAPPASFQPIGSITLTANSAGDAVLNNLALTFSTSSTAFLNTVVLKDPSGNDIVKVDGFASTSTAPGGYGIKWTFATSSVPLVVTAGQSYTLTLWGDLSTIPAISNQGLSLTATISNTGDFGYLDGTTGGNLINLTTNQVPVTVSNLSSGSGLQL
jgi:hypothetical protein